MVYKQSVMGIIYPGFVPASVFFLFLTCVTIQPGTGRSVTVDTLRSLSAVKVDANRDSVPDLLGKRVTVSGTATIGTGLFHESYLQVFIQDHASGLSLFSDSLGTPINAGDSIVATGVVQQYFGLTEVRVENYEVFPGLGRNIEPVSLDTVYKDPRPFEGILVHGTGEVIEKGTRYNGKYFMISPSDTSGKSLMVYVSNFHVHFKDFDFETISTGDRVAVTGILSKYVPNYSKESSYKIFLRTPKDLQFEDIPRWYLVLFLGGAVGISVLVVGWVITLRTRVQKKTEALSKSLKEKELLLHEIHHRVKNNLAIVSGLIDLQFENTQDPGARKVLENTQSRIRSMAIVHDKLYQTSALSDIDMEVYLGELARTIHETFANRHKDVELELDIEPVKLQVNQAIPCGLLVNELMVNAYKHAFDGVEEGKLYIGLSRTNGRLNLEINDNGKGMPDDFDIDQSDSLGMILVQTFASQLGAELELKNNGGSRFIIQFRAD